MFVWFKLEKCPSNHDRFLNHSSQTASASNPSRAGEAVDGCGFIPGADQVVQAVVHALPVSPSNALTSRLWCMKRVITIKSFSCL